MRERERVRYTRGLQPRGITRRRPVMAEVKTGLRLGSPDGKRRRAFSISIDLNKVDRRQSAELANPSRQVRSDKSSSRRLQIPLRRLLPVWPFCSRSTPAEQILQIVLTWAFRSSVSLAPLYRDSEAFFSPQGTRNEKLLSN